MQASAKRHKVKTLADPQHLVFTCCKQTVLFLSLVHWRGCLVTSRPAHSLVFIPPLQKLKKNLLCCLSFPASRWLWRRCWESPLQETAVWPATPDQAWSPILQGEKERHSCILISTSDRRLINAACTLAASYHIYLTWMPSVQMCVCVCVCVCYLCTISELSSVGFLIYKASFQPVLGREGGWGDFLWLSWWHVKSVEYYYQFHANTDTGCVF